MLDICTGSGAVAVSVAYLRADLSVSASDVSIEAVETARANGERHAPGRIRFVQSDLFTAFAGERFDLITANPPYVDSKIAMTLQRELTFEPDIALYAPEKGMAIIEKILASVQEYLQPDGLLLMELGHDQGRAVCNSAAQQGMSCEIQKDYAGYDRIALVKPQR